MEKNEKRLSKLMSKVLRHKPEMIGLSLDKAGWASVEELISKMNEKGFHMDWETLFSVVENNDKQRFALSPDRQYIRANQGHSIVVDHGFEAVEPPAFLYHGTATKNLDSILEKGLLKATGTMCI